MSADAVFATAFLSTFLIVYFIIIFAVAAFGIIIYWFLFKKAGEPGWASLIPFYNNYVFYKITWGKGWYFLLLLVPIANFVIGIITYVLLAKAYGQPRIYALGLVFFPMIFMAILAFNKSSYIGPQEIE